MATITESNSVEHSGAGTPLSDQSLRRYSPRVRPLLMFYHLQRRRRKTDRQTPNLRASHTFLLLHPLRDHDSQPKDFYTVMSLTSPHRPLSRMEKAILRRVEFGQNVDSACVTQLCILLRALTLALPLLCPIIGFVSHCLFRPLVYYTVIASMYSEISLRGLV